MQRGSRRRSRTWAGWMGTIVLIIVAALLQRWQAQPGGTRSDAGPLPAEVSGTPRLVDGDSFHLSGAEVRLKGIDAPEGRQTCLRDNGASWRCGDAARDELSRLIGSAPVVCKVADRDQHGRYLAFCTAGGRDLNREMVASGYAVAYGGYEREERDARARRRGLWSGTFEMPRRWRREHEGRS